MYLFVPEGKKDVFPADFSRIKIPVSKISFGSGSEEGNSAGSYSVSYNGVVFNFAWPPARCDMPSVLVTESNLSGLYDSLADSAGAVANVGIWIMITLIGVFVVVVVLNRYIMANLWFRGSSDSHLDVEALSDDRFDSSVR